MWVIFPILAAAAYSVSAFLQNYLTDTAFSKKHAGAYLVTQLLSFGVAMLVLLAIFGRGVFMLPLPMAGGLVLAGAINVIGTALYFKALKSGETLEVTIFGQSAPLIALALGAVFLGETVTTMQGLAFVLIMGAALILIFSTKNKKMGKLNLLTAGLAFASAFFWVVSDVVFVGMTGDGGENFQHFGQSFFYFEMGAFVATLVAVICAPSWRREVKRAFFGPKKGKNVAATVLDNGFFTAGEFLFKLGLMAAPAVALMTVTSHVAQLGIMFVLSIFLAKFFPRFAREKFDKKLVMQHLVAVILVVTGIILLG